jgi:hypothetical protein
VISENKTKTRFESTLIPSLLYSEEIQQRLFVLWGLIYMSINIESIATERISYAASARYFMI